MCLLLRALNFFLSYHHSITDFEINAILNQDSYRPLKFVSDLVSIFDTGWFCFTSHCHQPETRAVGHPCNPILVNLQICGWQKPANIQCFQDLHFPPHIWAYGFLVVNRSSKQPGRSAVTIIVTNEISLPLLKNLGVVLQPSMHPTAFPFQNGSDICPIIHKSRWKQRCVTFHLSPMLVHISSSILSKPYKGTLV